MASGIAEQMPAGEDEGLPFVRVDDGSGSNRETAGILNPDANGCRRQAVLRDTFGLGGGCPVGTRQAPVRKGAVLAPVRPRRSAGRRGLDLHSLPAAVKGWGDRGRRSLAFRRDETDRDLGPGRRTLGSSQGEHLLESLHALGPCRAGRFAAVDQHHEARDRMDAEPRRQILLARDVDLPHRIALSGELFDHRGHHAARRAIVAVEIQKYRIAATGRHRGQENACQRRHTLPPAWSGSLRGAKWHFLRAETG